MSIFDNNLIQKEMSLQGYKKQGKKGLFDEQYTIERLS